MREKWPISQETEEINWEICFPETLTATASSFTICEPNEIAKLLSLVIYFFVGDRHF
jgi:hypothetical protein